jgi:toxin-antitoxin system PIN domain toxin
LKLADSNFWLAISLSSHLRQPTASAWFQSLNESETVAFCRSTEQALQRLLTTKSVLSAVGSPPLTNEEAWRVLYALREHERVAYLDEPPGLEQHWQRLSPVPYASPKVWMDAYLAAFAIAGGHQLVTIDKAFTQFKGLDVAVLST